MSQSSSILIGLVFGIASAVALSSWLPALRSEASAVANLIGTLWFNAVRMTVVPLVMSLLITTVADAGGRRLFSRLGKKMVIVFVLLLLVTSVGAALLTMVLLPWLPGTAGVLAPLPAANGPTSDTTGRVDIAGWLVTLVPANPFKSAVENAILPLIIFSLAFAMALQRVQAASRDILLNSLRAVAEAMLILLSWVIGLAPVGIFCLSFGLITSAGDSAVGALGIYVVLLCTVVLLMIVAFFAVAVTFGAVPLKRFATTIAPALVVAFTSRSSMAALPVLIRAVREQMPCESMTGLLLPFSASVLRVSAPVQQAVGVLFVAHVFGIPLAPTQLVTLVAMSLLLSFAVPGIPGAGVIVMVPLFEAFKLPAHVIGLLLAVDVIPDAFKTMLNVTGHLTAATLIANDAAEPHAAVVNGGEATTV